MEKESLKKKTVNGVIWSAIDRFSTQGIQFVFSILIARLLMPSDYGVIAMLGIFLAVSNTFVDSGFGAALVQKANRTETDFSTVFYFNIVVAIIFYALLWLASPYIASFYNIPMLKDVTRVVALTLIFSALGGIQSAQLSIAINFKTRAIISLISALSTGCLGLYLAYSGYGAWALVFQMVFSSLLNTILLWCFVRWMPSLVFSWQSFRQLFSFGSKLLASALLDTIYNNVYTLVIGKVYSSSSLGLYSRASGLAQYPSSNITGVLQSVTFPVLCSIQNDEERLADAYKRFIRMSAFVVFPLMIGLASVAEPFIRVVLTDKWEGAIYLLQIVCFSMMWYPIHAINLNILQVKGRSDYFLKLEIIKKIQGVCILCITVPISIVAMCYGSIVSSLLSLVWNTYYTKRLIGYGFLSQIKDLLPIIIHSLLMGGIVLLVTHFIEVMWIKLFAGILAGGIYYILGAYIMHFDELKEVLAIIKRK
jgi:teichuronic acid exporter